MAGIDNITKEILQEAENRAQALVAEAQKKADGVLEAARKDAEVTVAKAGEKAEQDAKNYGERISSQIGLRARQASLIARQEVIEQVIEAAKKKLASQDAAAYFEMIAKLAARVVRNGSGEIFFGKADLERLPEAFSGVLEAVAAKAGGKLTISKSPADISNGFILKYGGIEENCTLDALFAEKHDSLLDKVNRVLW